MTTTTTAKQATRYAISRAIRTPNPYRSKPTRETTGSPGLEGWRRLGWLGDLVQIEYNQALVWFRIGNRIEARRRQALRRAGRAPIPNSKLNASFGLANPVLFI